MTFRDTEQRQAFASAFKTFPTLETERLILSEIVQEEAEEYHRQQRSALGLPDRPPWGFGLETESAEQAHRFIAFAYNAWQKKQTLRFGVRLKPEFGGKFQTAVIESSINPERPPLIGMVSIFDIQNQYKAEIGYWLGAAYHGQGLMTEAVQAVVSYVFNTMGMGRLYAYTSPRNTPSLGMLRKVGFVEEGMLRRHTLRDGKWDDSVVMGIIREDIS